jgi:peptidyl-prolyl cis-trans isomerase B (cyclophilin B)
MSPITPILVLLSVLIPTKTWYAVDQPVLIHVKATTPITLTLTDFAGQNIDSKAPADVAAEQTINIKDIFPLNNPGTYLLYAVPKGAAARNFVGTPLVIDIRADNRAGAPSGPMVVQVQPLVYAQMTTDKGPIVIAFYFSAAPHTVASFIRLAEGGFYDGLTFHRIVRGFVIQGGDPRGDGTGGPGYHLEAEFNDRPHEEGVLSMARQGDPNEPSAMPRCEFANSAGSQFFICLNYENTKQLDRRYTAFARVVSGMDAVRAIAAVPLASGETGRPEKPPRIDRIQIKPVTAQDNPYLKLSEAAATRPATLP